MTVRRDRGGDAGFAARWRRMLGSGAVASVLLGLPVLAAPPLPSPAELAAQTARRFPQPVQVGAIVGQDLLEPVESQGVLGRVVAVQQGADGAVSIVVAWGGVLGVGARRIALPADAVAYLGPQLALVGYTPEQASALPTVASVAPLPPEATIRLGIVRPFH